MKAMSYFFTATFGKLIKPLLLVLTIFGATFNTGQVFAANTEFVGSIEAVDVDKGVVTFSTKEFRSLIYQLAFDVRIRLVNGDIGALANLREGNFVTAVVDTTNQQVSYIQVHK